MRRKVATHICTCRWRSLLCTLSCSLTSRWGSREGRGKEPFSATDGSLVSRSMANEVLEHKRRRRGGGEIAKPGRNCIVLSGPFISEPCHFIPAQNFCRQTRCRVW